MLVWQFSSFIIINLRLPELVQLAFLFGSYSDKLGAEA